MLIYTINEGKPDEKTVHCPVSWEETTTDIFQRLIRSAKEGDDPIKIFSILTGTDYSALWEEENEILEAEIYRAVAFVFNQAQVFRVKPVPASIKIAGKTVELPTKLHKMTFGQNLIIRSRMAEAQKAGDAMETLISFALAVYLQRLIDGSKFDLDRAKELEADILKMNIFDTFPAGFFLLSKLNNSGASGLLVWLRWKIQRAKSRMKSLSWPTLHVLKPSMILALSMLMAQGSESFPARSSMSPSTRSCLSSCYGKNGLNFRNDLQPSKRPSTI